MKCEPAYHYIVVSLLMRETLSSKQTFCGPDRKFAPPPVESACSILAGPP